MTIPSTIGVSVVVTDGARPNLTSLGHDAVTVHVTGPTGQPSLHWASLAEAEAWADALVDQILTERLHRLDVETAIDEMNAALRRAGAR